jgi:hypothetical protein
VFGFSISVSAQMITHRVPQYELRFTDDKGIETKKIINKKAEFTYFGFCEGTNANLVLLVITSSLNIDEIVTLQILDKDVNITEKSTTFFATIVECDKNSLFYSAKDGIVIIFKNDNIAIGFAKVDLYMKKYSTKVKY